MQVRHTGPAKHMRGSGSTIAGRAPAVLGHTVGMRRAELRPPSAPLHRRAAVAAAAALLCLALGCTGARANSHYRYPRQVAYGRTSTCPDVRLPPLRDGNVSTDAARCSYADANGARVTHLAGKVLAEGGPGDPGVGVSAMKVTVHAVSSPLFDPSAPGPLIAHASTDAQGNYSLRGVFLPAQYAIVAHEPSGETIAYRVVRVEADGISGRLKAEGDADVAAVRGEFETKINALLGSPAGRAYVAWKSAENITFGETLTFQSREGVPSVLRLRNFALEFMGGG